MVVEVRETVIVEIAVDLLGVNLAVNVFSSLPGWTQDHHFLCNVAGPIVTKVEELRGTGRCEKAVEMSPC